MPKISGLAALLPLFVAPVGTAFAQSSILTCAASANPPVVHAEGITERTGDVLLTCNGGTPNARITGNLSLFLSVNVTNRISGLNNPDIALTVDVGSGPVSAGVAPALNGNTVAFNGVAFNLSAAGAATLRVSNLRGAASQLALAPGQFITVSVAFNGGSLVSITNNTFTVAAPQTGLAAGFSSKLICSQQGSVLPASITFADLIAAGTAFASTRVTEAFASSFAPRSDASNLNADSGLRIVARYGGFPAGAHIFVPDAVAGSDAAQPTAGGDFGLPASGGRYAGGSGTLLLIRVNGADPTGAGGGIAFQPPTAGVVAFNSVSEIPLSGGSGYAVYEVVDANPFVYETAQFPTFLGWSGGGTYQTTESVNLAPLSTVFTASTSAPVPRFLDTPPPDDCSLIGDCNADYFPELYVDTTPLAYTAAAGGNAGALYFPVRNLGGGAMQWSVSVAYANGAGWLKLYTTSGINNATVRVDASPASLTPGDYSATITVDAGPVSGSRTIQVTFHVTQPLPQLPQITSVTNAASLAPGPLVAGSLATIMGSRLSGHAVSVTFDGTMAALLYTSATQINLMVPPGLSGKTSAQLVVTTDGLSSASTPVTLAPVGPAIFNGGVLNQDGTPNSPSNPAQAGTILQVFATGLPANGVISAKVHDRPISSLYYGGPAPGIPGVQQVDVAIPADLPSMNTWVYVCGAINSQDAPACSVGAVITIVQQ